MSFIKKTASIIGSKLSDYANTIPQSFKDGNTFKKIVEKQFFPNHHFELLYKTFNSTYNINHAVNVKEYTAPDFRFRSRKTQIEFYVQAKFQNSLYQGAYEWCSHEYFKKYHSFNKPESPVFLLLGLAGSPAHPKHVFFIPLSECRNNKLTPTLLEKYEKDSKKSIDYNDLIKKL